MTFQQAHRFTALQVSNRDYNKTEAQNQGDDAKRHINELQLLTTKGRVWSLTGYGLNVLSNLTFSRTFSTASCQTWLHLFA